MTTMPLYPIRTDRPATPATTTGMDPWLVRRLEAAGVLDPDTGASRKAKVRRCQVCHRPVFLGYDADWAGQVAICDPDPLSRDGEALARIAGLRTWMLSFTGTYQLDYRDRWRIRGWPAATKKFDVLAQHQCTVRGAQVVALPRTPSVLADDTTSRLLPDTAPF